MYFLINSITVCTYNHLQCFWLTKWGYWVATLLGGGVMLWTSFPSLSSLLSAFFCFLECWGICVLYHLTLNWPCFIVLLPDGGYFLLVPIFALLNWLECNKDNMPFSLGWCYLLSLHISSKCCSKHILFSWMTTHRPLNYFCKLLLLQIYRYYIMVFYLFPAQGRFPKHFHDI